MGATGSGKSSVGLETLGPTCACIDQRAQFINTASGSQLRVGMGLTSCTAGIQLADELIIDGRRVILIDTPGFDDTNVSDAEILNMIGAFLATTWVLSSAH